MRAKFTAFSLVLGGLLLAASPALAQTSLSGAVKGIITDKDNGGPVAGATVVFSGPALQGTQAEITSDDGSYYVANLPPGTYQMTVYFADGETTRSNVLVQLGKVSQVNLGIATSGGEVVEVIGRAPVIDQGSTKTGVTIGEDFTQNIPSGRTFGAVLGAASGSQDDLYGVSFGGSTSAENIYIVEGLNTTDPAYGLLSTNLPNEFVQETEVITGGYNAEYGRSTGGIVNVVTKSGSNEFHGSVFTYFTPGQLVADEVATPSAGSAIDRVDEISYRADIGGEVGGPIIKDRLWFHVGFNPSFVGQDHHRIIKSRVDDNDDGAPDVDANGFNVLEEVGRHTYNRTRRTLFFTAKLTGAVTPDHQGSLSFLGNPEKRQRYIVVGGAKDNRLIDIDDGAWDVSGKWTSKFNNNKTQIDLVAGFHRNVQNETPVSGLASQPMVRIDTQENLSDFAQYESEFDGGLPGECQDGGPDDRYPSISNCPVRFYNIGGVGFNEDQTTDRIALVGSITQRVNVVGHHKFKIGADFEHQAYDHLREHTGGVRYRRRSFGPWQIDRFYHALPPETANAPDMCDIAGTGDPAPCERAANGLAANTTTQNIAAYAQDSWQLLPNLTINAGVRWEQQTLFVADELEGTISPDTGQVIDAEAFKLSNMIAPRIGVIYDPTQEGRSKIFGHYGRFYESIPMDINTRAFGGELTRAKRIDPGAAGNECYDVAGIISGNSIQDCDEDMAVLDNEFFFGGGESGVVPGIKGQYMDEIVIGGKYELLNDLKVGASYIRRGLGRVIEDISTDGGNTYVIANPGESNESAIVEELDRQRGILSGMDMTAEEVDAEIERLGQLYRDAATFDAPSRQYDALELSAEKRFTRNLMAKASYTYSRTKGNFPGLFSPETGQLDPNLTSMYDLPDLMANRTGPLASDRPHLFKLDGYYSLNAKELGFFTFGSSVRASSGIPHNTLGAHIFYGTGESYLLPRGAAKRSPFITQFDIHVSYGRQLNKNMKIEAFMDVFNLFNQQAEIDVDENYTFEPTNPIVDGDESDLAHLKGIFSNHVAEKNANFGNPNDRQAPLSMRFGMRLIF